jgi:hypothetical protein
MKEVGTILALVVILVLLVEAIRPREVVADDRDDD